MHLDCWLLMATTVMLESAVGWEVTCCNFLLQQKGIVVVVVTVQYFGEKYQCRISQRLHVL